MAKIGDHTVTFKDALGTEHAVKIPLHYHRSGRRFRAKLPERIADGLKSADVSADTELELTRQIDEIAAQVHLRSARERMAIRVEAEGEGYGFSRGRGDNVQSASLSLSYKVMHYREWVDRQGNVIRQEYAECKRDADTGEWAPEGKHRETYRYSSRDEEQRREIPFTEIAVHRLDLIIAQIRTLRNAIDEQVSSRAGVTALIEGRAALMLGPAKGEAVEGE